MLSVRTRGLLVPIALLALFLPRGCSDEVPPGEGGDNLPSSLWFLTDPIE